MITPKVRQHLVSLARQAGDAIMDIYQSRDVGASTKDDGSPITKADQASQRVLQQLEGYLSLPLISEEGNLPDFEMRSNWPAFWLIDPLDGTKEFLQRNGDFTVNIALIQNGVATYGVVHVPVTGDTFVGGAGKETLKLTADGQQRLSVAAPHDGPIRVALSRNHLDAETEAFVANLGEVERLVAGSSLKFCHIAEGAADVYPRFAPTMEWDTGAGQAIVEGAGGTVLADGEPLRYNREDMRNPPFVARAPWVDA